MHEAVDGARSTMRRVMTSFAHSGSFSMPRHSRRLGILKAPSPNWTNWSSVCAPIYQSARPSTRSLWPHDSRPTFPSNFAPQPLTTKGNVTPKMLHSEEGRWGVTLGSPWLRERLFWGSRGEGADRAA